MKIEPGQVKSIFLHAVEHCAPGEWGGYLDQACGENTELRRRVMVLLDAHEIADSLIDTPEPTTAHAAGCSDRDQTGSVIGPYKLLQPIGEGGMGTVYMAEQTQPVKRTVALKLIKAGMDTRQVLARFEAERQALALMDHPNIAKVLDAGTTGAGADGASHDRPYFVMELVKGVSIIRHCDEHRLTPRQRLELFIPVCHAVQHAHQKAIIHRDLKPSNILVAQYDGRPVPKVIDFGVAKAAGPLLTDKSLVTGFGSLIGTLEYMSPEQAEINQLDIDTRSDIYSLGVVLYELLTGSTPLDRKRLKHAAFTEMLRIIREEEPPKPSTRLSDSTESLSSISAQRHMEPAKLTKFVRGELDWIVMKALDKDRSRRYETANGFAVDVQHYLDDEPVQARPPSVWYRLGKFVRRNRGPVLAASLVLLALVGGVLGTSFGLLRARNAADAERAAKEMTQQRLTQLKSANELLRSVFKDLDPHASEDGQLQAELGERLDEATTQLEGAAIGDPLAVARMQVTLGESQIGLDHAEKGIQLLTKARTTFARELGPHAAETLKSMSSLALGYSFAGKFDLALALQGETLELMRVKLGPDDLSTIKSMSYLAACYNAKGKFVDRALPLFEESFERMKGKFPPDHPEVLRSMCDLAYSYYSAAKPDLARPLLENALKRSEPTLGPDHSITLKIMTNLALVYRAADMLDLAVPLFAKTFERTRVKFGPNHLTTLDNMNHLALAYQDVHRLDLALPLYKDALEKRKAKLSPDHLLVVQSMNNLAWGYEAAEKFDLALPLYEEALARIEPTLGHRHVTTVRLMNNLGRCYVRLGQPSKAGPLLRECLAIGAQGVQDEWRTFDTKSLLGAALLGEKKYSEAEPLLLAGYQGMKEREATMNRPFRIRLIDSLNRLVQFYEATENPDKAKEWRRRLAEAKDSRSD